jgi:6-pyruvoyltetrahydropterin/6-carboxytetrahydropterin synthase
MIVYVSRQEHFNAAHKLYNPNWSEEKNIELFGPCANSNWHGHNFDLIVTVKGEPDQETGFVIDHKNLNLDVDFMKDKMASTEILAIEFWKILDSKITTISNGRGKLHCVKLYETPRNYVEYYGG